MYLAMKYLNAPVVITKDIRADYMELLANQDVRALADILAKSLVDERERMTQFN